MRVRATKKNGKPRLNGYDRKKMDEFISAIDDGGFILITMKEIGPPGSEQELKEQLRKYYFSQVAGPSGEEIGHSAIYFHMLMKNALTKYRDEKTGLEATRSVFSESSDMSNDERKAFIKQVKAMVLDLYPEMKFPDFEM